MGRRLQDPVSPLAFVGCALRLGALLEEPGWGGYALGRCERLGNALTASLRLGVLWTCRHLPPFFIPGSYQAGLVLGASAFGLFSPTAVAASVVITWIYAPNDRGIFAAILFHASLNLRRETVAVPERTEALRAALLVILAGPIAWRRRPRTLRQCG